MLCRFVYFKFNYCEVYKVYKVEFTAFNIGGTLGTNYINIV